jgi:hypothetical protein
MSNVIARAVEALEEAAEAIAIIEARFPEKWPEPSEFLTELRARTDELRRYEVVEGYTSHSDFQEWPRMVLAIGPTPSDARWRPAILLAEKEETP